jgi:hypothetical protein
LTIVSFPSLFFEETGVGILLVYCAFDFLFAVFLYEKTFMGVHVRISECFALLFNKVSMDPSAVMGILVSGHSCWRGRIGIPGE